MDLTSFVLYPGFDQRLDIGKNILVDHGVRPANKEGIAAYDRAFTEETCILIALVNGFDRVVILNYPHRSHFKNGVHLPHPNHITAAFGNTGGKIEKAHIYLSELRPYVICRREDAKIDLVWGGHLGYTFTPILSQVVHASIESNRDHVYGLRTIVVHRKPIELKLKTTGILGLGTWRHNNAEPKRTINSSYVNGDGKSTEQLRSTSLTPERLSPTSPQQPFLPLSRTMSPSREPLRLSRSTQSNTFPDGSIIEDKENMLAAFVGKSAEDTERKSRYSMGKFFVDKARSDTKRDNNRELRSSRNHSVIKGTKDNQRKSYPNSKLGKISLSCPAYNSKGNWRKTMSPLPSFEEKEDSWRQLQRLAQQSPKKPKIGKEVQSVWNKR